MTNHNSQTALLIASSNVGTYDLETGSFIEPFVEPNEDGLQFRNFGLSFATISPPVLLVSSRDTGEIKAYDQQGNFITNFITANSGGEGIPANPDAFVITPNNDLYLSSTLSGDILRYNATTGEFLGDFVNGGDPNTDSLVAPIDMVLSSNHQKLYVANFSSSEDLLVPPTNQDSILVYDLVTGVLEKEFSFTNGNEGPLGLTLDATGDNLYVGTFADGVWKFDTNTGVGQKIIDKTAFIPGERGSIVADLVFKDNENLLVADFGGNRILDFDISDPLNITNKVFASTVDNALITPTALKIGSEGELFVTGAFSSNVVTYDLETGAFIETFVKSNEGGLDGTNFGLGFATISLKDSAKLEQAYIIGQENFDSWSQGFDADGYLKVLPHSNEKVEFKNPFAQWQQDNQDYENGNFVYEAQDGSYYSSWGPKEVLEVVLNMDELEQLVIDGFGTLEPGDGFIDWLGKATPYDILRAYNGQITGPMLITEPGDTIKITLNNNLDQVTNLHTHGLHVSPVGNGDNVLITIQPGESWEIEIKIPEDHFIGPDWYHPHLHGETNAQVASGLGGYLIINPPHDLPDFKNYDFTTEPAFFMAINSFGIQQENRPSSPDDPLNQSNPEVLVPAGTPLLEIEPGVYQMSDAPFVGYNAKPATYDPTNPSTYGQQVLSTPTENVIHTVNGQYNPTIETSTGTWNLFSFVNMTVNSFHVIQLIKEETDGTLTPQEMILVAIDGDGGGVVEDVRRDITESPILNPGSRISVQNWFEEPGKYYFIANATEEILGDYAPFLTREDGFHDGHLIWGPQVLATVEVTGEPIITGEFPQPYDFIVRKNEEINALVDTYLEEGATQERNFVWSANIGGALSEGNLPEDTKVSTFQGTYRINGEYFATEGGGMPPLTMPMLNSTEVWTLSNTSGISDEKLAELGIDIPLLEWHPFHIHQNDFVVLEINGIPVEDIEQTYLARVLSDTIALPPSYQPGSATPQNPYGIAQINGEPSEVKILMEFADYPGSYVNHCHILFHEDAGMMAVVRVILNTDDTWLGLGNDSGSSVNLFKASNTDKAIRLNAYNSANGVDVAIADVNYKNTLGEGNNNVTDNVTDVITIQSSLSSIEQRFTVKVFDGKSMFAQTEGNTFELEGDDPNILLTEFNPFSNLNFTRQQQAEIASGDINGDGFADIITALGGGITPIIEIYSGKDYSLLGNLNPFHHSSFTGKINVSVGDINGDNFDDILTAQGEGGSGLVEAYSGILLDELIRSGEINNLTGTDIAHETALLTEEFRPYGDSYSGEIEITSGYILQTPDVPNDYAIQTNAANITTLAVGDLPEGQEKIKIHTFVGGGHHSHRSENGEEENDSPEVRLDKEFTPDEDLKEISGTFADVNGNRGQGVLFAQGIEGESQLIHLQEENIPEYIEVTPPIPPELEIPTFVTGTPRADDFDSAFPDDKLFVGDKQILFTGGGRDYVDVSQVGRRNRIDTGSGDDIVFAGTRNRIILGAGDDIIFASSGRGANHISLGAGKDQLWLTEDDNAIPRNPNRVSDFNPDEDIIGFANTNLSLGSDDFSHEQVGDNVIIFAFGREIALLLNTSVTDDNFVFS